MSEMDRCHTCGGDVGEHYGQCPEGAQPLPMWDDPAQLRAWMAARPIFYHHGRGGMLTYTRIAELEANIPRETLRLSVEDLDPEQPQLFEELTS
jgi:hypothetical protein